MLNGFKITTLLFIFFTFLWANETINQGSEYEAIIKEDSGFIKIVFKDTTKQALDIKHSDFMLHDDTHHYYRVDDINFDGLDDLTVVIHVGKAQYFYTIYLAKDRRYTNIPNSYIANYTLDPTTQAMYSKEVSGAKTFHTIYSVKRDHLKHFATYFDQKGSDKCYLHKLYGQQLKPLGGMHKIVSCKQLKGLKKQPVYAKIIKAKALLYDDQTSQKSNGMYLIKDDFMELLRGSPDHEKTVIRFSGKRVVESYIDNSDYTILEGKYFLQM